jgi:hypothetical protein
MKIKATKEFTLNFTHLKEGDTTDVEENVGKDLVAKGYAVISTQTAAKPVVTDKPTD